MNEDPMNDAGAESGFTLIELLVAMTVTVIITGAMYGLLAGGQNAFRREPELTDRQQSIRMAMDRVQRDVLIAGQKMGTFAQAFTWSELGEIHQLTTDLIVNAVLERHPADITAEPQQKRKHVAVRFDGVGAEIALRREMVGQEVGKVYGEVGRLHDEILRGMTSPNVALVRAVTSGNSSAVRCR